MEEIQYKLHSKDPVMISHALSKVLLRVQEEYQIQKDITKIPEYKLLLSKCESEDALLATSSYHALVMLAETGMLSTTFIITNIISNLPSVKNQSALVTAVGHMLAIEMQSRIATEEFTCPYSLENHQHPFVTILAHEKDCWRSVLDQIKSVTNASNTLLALHSTEFFRPVFVYIMCNPLHTLDGCKEEIWRLLIASEHMFKLQLDILRWFCTNDAISCVNTNSRILELAEMAFQRENKELCSMLVPLIASVAIHLLKYGYDPTSNFNSISTIMQFCDNFTGNITLNLMMEIVAMCPSVYLPSVLKICNSIVDSFECHSTLLYAFLSSLLKWTAYPSVLCVRTLNTAKALTNKISFLEGKRTELSKDKYDLARLCHIDPKIHFYYEINRYQEVWSSKNALRWLKNVRDAPIDIKYKCRYILSGFALEYDNPEIVTIAIDTLTEIAKDVSGFASHVLCLIFYKLTKTCDIVQIKRLLLVLPQLLVAKENVPTVINILETFYNSRSSMQLFSIMLYAKAMESDPRCLRYVLTALARTIKSETSWQSASVCAKVIRDICSNQPEHGEELVPMISQILNRSSDVNGSAASSFALESIAALCRSAVIGICSTWRVLAPKFNTETRPVVLRSLCKLFGEVPYFPVQSSEDYESLILEVVTKLWKFVFTSKDVGIVRAALEALTNYRLESIPLKTLPQELKKNIVPPKKYSKDIAAESANSEICLTYVPGHCWIEMLATVNAAVLSSAGDLLISFIEDELRSFHSGIYIWPQGEPPNFMYLPERSVIRAVGERLRRHEKYNLNDNRVTLECLRIFAHGYEKPIPNINWNFLQQLVTLSSESKRYCHLIAARHAPISASAKDFIEDVLSVYNGEICLQHVLEAEEFLILYSTLQQLLSSLQPNDLKTFLEVTLNYITKSFSLNREATKSFDAIMQSYAKALKSTLHDENRSMLSSNLEELLQRIDLQHSSIRNSYTAAVLQMSKKDIERMTSPSLWLETSEMKLRNAIIVRTDLATNTDIDAPLSFLEQLIDVAASTPEVQDCLFESIGKIQCKVRLNSSTPGWTLDFIAHVEQNMKAVPEANVAKIEFYCKVLLLSLIFLSGVNMLMIDSSSVIHSLEVQCRLLPMAIRTLMDRDLWKNKIPQIMEWLNYMRMSNISHTFKSAFYNALILLKHELHYRKTWMKYMPVNSV